MLHSKQVKNVNSSGRSEFRRRRASFGAASSASPPFTKIECYGCMKEIHGEHPWDHSPNPPYSQKSNTSSDYSEFGKANDESNDESNLSLTCVGEDNGSVKIKDSTFLEKETLSLLPDADESMPITSNIPTALNMNTIVPNTSTVFSPLISHLLEETEGIVRAVQDTSQVTVRVIYESLESKFKCTLDATTKKVVKSHVITYLAEIDIEKKNLNRSSSTSNAEDVGLAIESEGFIGDSDESVDLSNDDDEEEDGEYDIKPRPINSTRKKKCTRSKKSSSTVTQHSTSSSSTRSQRRLKKDLKIQAMRIHAEAQRKRRMDELRVRHEELQVESNAKDQKRAEEIAAKFDTNTDEIREKRLEQRMGLLSKLDEKRMTVIHQNHAANLVELAEESNDESEEEDVLEIEGSPKLLAPHVRQPTALLLLDLADHQACRHQLKKQVKKKTAYSPSRSVNARAALKNNLNMKRRLHSNMWLARELGYKSEKDHLKDCLEAGNKKQDAARKHEHARIKRTEFIRERLLQDIDVPDAYNDVFEASSGNDSFDEEDEEMALARGIYKEGNPDVLENQVVDRGLSLVSSHVTSLLKIKPPMDEQDSNNSEMPTSSKITKDITCDESITNVDDDQCNGCPCNDPVAHSESLGEQDTSSDCAPSESTKPKRPRNTVWKAILEKEAAHIRKSKRNKSSLIEDEADEEEDEQVAGLEDFGFSIHKKKKDEDENDQDVDEDDLNNVVDDLSDNEGDELAGANARKKMDLREEQDRHKEILRRLRDGYDGRRGGIAGGGFGARGVHRFDQLVAADNREDAKRLGLLNDDEMESDNDEDGEKSSAQEEEEDEGALIDKLLKDRFLHRGSTQIEEEFSEDDEEQDETLCAEDAEDKEQERLAKRFAKRARMQRLIEAHGHEEEFSRSKLIDEDFNIKLELQKMKNGLVRKRSAIVLSTADVSICSNEAPGCKKPAFASRYLQGGSLAIALQISRSCKAKTSFARSNSITNSESIEVASNLKSNPFNGVVFSSNSNSGFARTTMKRNASSVGAGSSKTSGSYFNQNNNFAVGKSNQGACESLWSQTTASSTKFRK